MQSTLRPRLGDFSSIICFKAVITGMEEALGAKATAIALIAADRNRGKSIAKSLNLDRTSQSLDEIASKVRFVLSEDGTRLCILEKIATCAIKIAI